MSVGIPTGRSSGFCLWCWLNSVAGLMTPLAFSYNSNTVDVHPILGGTITSDPGDPVPASIEAQVTWDGTTYSSFNLSTAGGVVGGSYSFAFQVPDEVTTSQRRLTIDWQVTRRTPMSSTAARRHQAVDVATNSTFGSG